LQEVRHLSARAYLAKKQLQEKQAINPAFASLLPHESRFQAVADTAKRLSGRYGDTFSSPTRARLRQIRNVVTEAVVLEYTITVYVDDRRARIEKRYNAKKRGERVKPVWRTSRSLLLHILAGLFELVRYYTRGVDGDVVPEVLDTAACFAQAFTTLHRSKTLLRGDIMTRPSYQAPALMRPFARLTALVYQSPSIHRASVKLLHTFLYTRMIIFLVKRFGVDKTHSNTTIYAHAVFLGAIMPFMILACTLVFLFIS
ncbi:hypothetical protein CDV36_016510, partial [Fusarium kuroshium]